MKRKNIILILVIIFVIAAIFYLENKKINKANPGNVNLSSGLAPEITQAAGFINTDKISIHDQIGKKIVLLDFWTYSCINCQRTLPYLVAWDKKYTSKGLQIIGVHTPEFDFEKNYTNVSNFVKEKGITYPVVLDSNYGTWNAYGNQYWPADYLIDLSGKVVDTHFGEGGYDTTEHEIQKLLGLSDTSLVTPSALTPTQNQSISPETYFGSARNQYLGNGLVGQSGIQNLTEPVGTDLDTLYLSGKWNFTNEYAETMDANEKIFYRFQAKNVYFVAGAKTPTKIKILIDGKEIGEQIIKDNTLYTLYQGKDFGEHVLEIDVMGAGLQAYTFTFG
jgi:thiol-disulfide isomerase/thioredoxin